MIVRTRVFALHIGKYLIRDWMISGWKTTMMMIFMNLLRRLAAAAAL